jgi:hypothetical protein
LQGVEPVLSQIQEIADAVRGLSEVGCGCGRGGREGRREVGRWEWSSRVDGKRDERSKVRGTGAAGKKESLNRLVL